DSTITCTTYDFTYDSDPHNSIGTYQDLNSLPTRRSSDLHTTHTNAGTYNNDYWSFSDSTGNYNNVGNTIITDHIAKADATITVTPDEETYELDSQADIGSAKGLKKESLSGLDLSHTTHTK